MFDNFWEVTNKEHYEKITLALSLIAYDFSCFVGTTEAELRKAIMDDINNNLFFNCLSGKYNVVWGPVSHSTSDDILNPLHINDTFAFIVQSTSDPEEYILVIRGTNPISIESWLLYDAWVGGMVRWEDVLSSASETEVQNPRQGEPGVSAGTYFAMKVLTSLTDSSNMTIDTFLGSSEKKANKIIVTGHSLGGLLSSTYAAWLCEKLPAKKAAIQAFAYAGPTAGNREFSEYSNKLLKGNCTRYENPYDIACCAWDKDKLGNLIEIYNNRNPLEEYVKNKAAVLLNTTLSEKGYTQIREVEYIPWGFMFTELSLEFFVQAAIQHILPYMMHYFFLTLKGDNTATKQNLNISNASELFQKAGIFKQLMDSGIITAPSGKQVGAL